MGISRCGTPSLAHTWRKGCKTIGEDRSRDPCSGAFVGRGSTGIDLAHPGVEPVVGESVRCRTRSRNLGHPRLVVVGEVGADSARGDGGRAARRVVCKGFGGRTTHRDLGELVTRVVGVGFGRPVQGAGGAVAVGVVGVAFVGSGRPMFLTTPSSGRPESTPQGTPGRGSEGGEFRHRLVFKSRSSSSRTTSRAQLTGPPDHWREESGASTPHSKDLTTRLLAGRKPRLHAALQKFATRPLAGRKRRLHAALQRVGHPTIGPKIAALARRTPKSWPFDNEVIAK